MERGYSPNACVSIDQPLGIGFVCGGAALEVLEVARMALHLVNGQRSIVNGRRSPF